MFYNLTMFYHMGMPNLTVIQITYLAVCISKCKVVTFIYNKMLK